MDTHDARSQEEPRTTNMALDTLRKKNSSETYIVRNLNWSGNTVRSEATSIWVSRADCAFHPACRVDFRLTARACKGQDISRVLVLPDSMTRRLTCDHPILRIGKEAKKPDIVQRISSCNVGRTDLFPSLGHFSEGATAEKSGMCLQLSTGCDKWARR